MAAEDKFLQVPPDSNGKYVQMFPWNDGVNDIHTPVNQVADRNDPKKKLGISSAGEASVTFRGGSPIFTSFNRLAISEESLLGLYKLYQPEYFTTHFDNQFDTTVAGGGTVTYDTPENGVKLSIGVASGAKAAFHSHRHYIYSPKNSMPLVMSFKAGDAGKTNLVRRHGWFGNAGNIRVLIEMTENDVEFIVEDDDLSYSQRVSKVNWNRDKLDGTGGDNNLSGVALDLTKNTVWWIDFQYLSAGAVRFGQMINGEMVTCHVMGNYNALDRPWCSNPSFSFGTEIENIGVAPSSSETICYCGVITNDGYHEFDEEIGVIRAEITLTDNAWTPVFSIRPTQLKGGIANRDRIVPKVLDLFSSVSSIEIVSEVNPTIISGDTWAGQSLNIEYDTTGVVTQGTGIEKSGHFSGAGEVSEDDLEGTYSLQMGGIHRHYDVSDSDHITFFAKKLIADDTDTLVKMLLHVAEV